MSIKRKVRAFAPATVANVCCGFDVLGFAVDNPGDEVLLTLRDDTEIRIESIIGDQGKLPLDANKNTASVAIQSLLRKTGHPIGVDITLYKNLPLGSGMGSSAASGVAALVAMNNLLGEPLSRTELVEHAAPSLLGGFVLVRDYQPLDVIKIPLAIELYCTLVHPHLELNTSDSRKVLKPTVKLTDAIIQSGNIAGLMLGLMKPDGELIARSLKDVFAEPIRSAFIPGFHHMREIAIQAGSLGFGISGSGPTVFALSIDIASAERTGQLIKEQFLKHDLRSDVFISKVNQQGARIIE